MINRLLLIIGNLLIFAGLTGMAGAQTLQSNDYQINESYIGPGGTVNSGSAHYGESSTVGDIGVSGSSSGAYQATSGFNTTSDPRLSLVINSSNVSFGHLSTTVPSTGTATFSVLNYTAHGYSVYILGSAPTNGSHPLNSMNSVGSMTGHEQFGINLAGPNNVGAGNFGAPPAQVPATGGFSFGLASTGYDSANTFRYGNGEEIAQSNKTSGETDYTISYVVNVSTTTPGGSYTSDQLLLVVGAY